MKALCNEGIAMHRYQPQGAAAWSMCAAGRGSRPSQAALRAPNAVATTLQGPRLWRHVRQPAEAPEPCTSVCCKHTHRQLDHMQVA